MFVFGWEKPILLLCCRCAALLDSSPPAVQFVASKRPNVVRFILNTSLVIPEVRLCHEKGELYFLSLSFDGHVKPPYLSKAVCPLHRPPLRPAHHFGL